MIIARFFLSGFATMAENGVPPQGSRLIIATFPMIIALHSRANH